MSSAKTSGGKVRKARKERELAKTFGKNVRRVRNERRLSQEALADVVRLAVTYVGQIERGTRNPQERPSFHERRDRTQKEPTRCLR